MTKPKIGPVFAVVLLSVMLGGCTLKEAFEKAVEVVRDVQAGVGLGKDVLIAYCQEAQASVAAVEAAAAKVKSCKVKEPVAKGLASIRAVCNNVNYINPNDLKSVIASAKKTVSEIKAAQAAGC